jgi:hypothetical protein
MINAKTRRIVKKGQQKISELMNLYLAKKKKKAKWDKAKIREVKNEEILGKTKVEELKENKRIRKKS